MARQCAFALLALLAAPAGSYDVTVVLFGPGDTRRAAVTRHVEVLGRTGE